MKGLDVFLVVICHPIDFSILFVAVLKDMKPIPFGRSPLLIVGTASLCPELSMTVHLFSSVI